MTTDTLTELEGAILSLLGNQEPMTAYAVRTVFRKSRSEFWSGSAGAIYPAIRRLEARGLIAGEDVATGRRSGREFRLSGTGAMALRRWAMDAAAAAGAGFDPFRVRTLAWDILDDADRAALRDRLTTEIERRVAALETGEFAKSPQADLEARLQRSRLAWLADQS